jgi:hypothetical protein
MSVARQLSAHNLAVGFAHPLLLHRIGDLSDVFERRVASVGVHALRVDKAYANVRRPSIIGQVKHHHGMRHCWLKGETG